MRKRCSSFALSTIRMSVNLFRFDVQRLEPPSCCFAGAREKGSHIQEMLRLKLFLLPCSLLVELDAQVRADLACEAVSDGSL
jgi:hypothetical protein